MNADQTFRIALIVIAFMVLPVAIYHRIKSQATGESLDRWQEGVFILFTLRLIGISLWVGIFAYLINPKSMAWSSVSLPEWLRWLGIACGVIGGGLLMWTLPILGKNLTDTVVTRRNHTLVSTGPYRWVRHPFYDAVTLYLTANAVGAANWFLMLGGAGVVTLLVMRTRIEEEKLILRFGDAYRSYIARTGRFLPRIRRTMLAVLMIAYAVHSVHAGSQPIRSKTGMVISASGIASQVGAQVLRNGGNAIDAAVATAFALAVTHPTAGNIGGGGFLLYRSAAGETAAFDFRETAPSRSSPTMFLKDGKYDPETHHNSHLSVGVPGTVAGLHLAWKEKGSLPWKRLVEPAITLARGGFVVTDGLARSLSDVMPQMQKYPASVAQFTRNGAPYRAGDILKQSELAATLERIANRGPAGFYEGETAAAIEKEMQAHGGLITRDDLKKYTAIRRAPVRATYRGYDVISMPPPSSGGVALIEMLNILEGYDIASMGSGSSAAIHVMAESMKRAFADRAKNLGDSDFNTDMPIERLISKPYAAELRNTIRRDRTINASPTSFEWPKESDQTTHISIVDADRNAVALTYTLEQEYGSKIVVPGGGFLLNNEMGDFNAAPGLTTVDGLIGTPPNLAQPGKRMLSSMTPTVLVKDGRIFMVTGSPGGRTIINTVLQTIVNVVDFGMNAQEAVDAGRIHHQWLPDRIMYERFALSPDTLAVLRAKGHDLREGRTQGVAEVIVHNIGDGVLEGGVDRRQPDGAAASQ